MLTRNKSRSFTWGLQNPYKWRFECCIKLGTAIWWRGSCIKIQTKAGTFKLRALLLSFSCALLTSLSFVLQPVTWKTISAHRIKKTSHFLKCSSRTEERRERRPAGGAEKRCTDVSFAVTKRDSFTSIFMWSYATLGIEFKVKYKLSWTLFCSCGRDDQLQQSAMTNHLKIHHHI